MARIALESARFGVLPNSTRLEIAVSRCERAVYATSQQTFVCRFCTRADSHLNVSTCSASEATSCNTSANSDLYGIPGDGTLTVELRQMSCLSGL